MLDLQKHPRVVIEQVSPLLDDGHFPIKRLVKDRIEVGAAIYKDGHDMILAQIRSRLLADGDSRLDATISPLYYDEARDHWQGNFLVDRVGNWEMWIEAWTDLFGTWRRDLQKRLDAGQDILPELLEGAVLVKKRVQLATEEEKEPLTNAANALIDTRMRVELRLRIAFSQTLRELMHGPLDEGEVASTPQYPVRVDRREAGFAAWYELFPRSQGTDPHKHGTFKDTASRITEIAAMGFEVLYLPPIHPIGTVHRKGRNNTTTAQAHDVGCPWAIGSSLGGHSSVHPELGTLKDFRDLIQVCSEFGVEIALDFALQCAPDHPWVKEHPDWFFIRPDGTIRYAENPPKKYEDIYPLNFWGERSNGLWEAARDTLFFWVQQGVKTFRVDNPHTKPLSFWQWCIQEVQEKHPEVVFLSESFTRPNRMKGLAKLGFSQSYTYFTWKNSKKEFTDYLTELTQTPMAEYYRPNFFTNTPDILHEYLQKGGRPAFRIRLLLAATTSPLYGIYSGYELCENIPVRPGSEEYLNSEKYEIQVRDWNAPNNIKRDISRLNAIRSREPALQVLTNIEFCPTESDDIIAYIKWDRHSGADQHLLMVVNLNPHEVRETTIQVPLESLGLRGDVEYRVKDLLTGTSYTWRGSSNYVRLDPTDKVGHLFRIEFLP